MTTARSSATLRISRYDPSSDDHPRFQTYEVPLEPGMNVLQALTYVYRCVDPTIAFRTYACGKGICQSCSMLIDGQKKRACSTQVEHGATVTIEPLPGSRVIRDLVVSAGEAE